MLITPTKLKVIAPPKDDLLARIYESGLQLKNGDILAVASKVVSIDEGRCVPIPADKLALARREASVFVEVEHSPRWLSLFTITKGVLIRNAGIDESNGNNHYILWPRNPQRSAKRLRIQLMKHYKISRVAVIITDSISTPLRRGAVGFALAWAGFKPLYDYRGEKDIFGRIIQVEQANMADALAAAAVLTMGEGSEQTPIARIENLPEKIWRRRRTKRKWSEFIVPLRDDLFEPFLGKLPWKKGGSYSRLKSSQR